MADTTASQAALSKMWQRVNQTQQFIDQLQIDMVIQAPYLRQGSPSRINKYVRQLERELADLERTMVEFDSEAPTQLYFDGLRSSAPKGLRNFTTPSQDAQLLQQIAQYSVDSHHRELSTLRTDMRRYGNTIRKSKASTFTEEGPATFVRVPGQSRRLRVPGALRYRDNTISEWIQRNRVRGVQYIDGRKVPLVQHETMSLHTVKNRTYNLGRIRGFEEAHKLGKGPAYLEVTDGAGCGWIHHDDGDVANGKIVTFEEARANPISHPNCTRQFHPTKKTPPKDDEKDKGLSTAKKVALGVAGIALAAEASNVLAKALPGVVQDAKTLAQAKITQFASSALLETMREGVLRKAMETLDAEAFDLERRIGAFQAQWSAADSQELNSNLVPLFKPQEVPGIQIGQELKTGTEGARFNFKAALGDGSIPPSMTPSQILREGVGATRASMNSAAWLPQKMSQLEKDIFLMSEAYAKGVLDQTGIPRKLRSLMFSTAGTLEDRFSIFSRVLKNKTIREMGGDELKRALQYEAQIKRFQQITMFNNTAAESSAKFSWSRFGPRTRVDITEWLRAKTTSTPTGIIHSLTVAPKRALRANLKVFQDGTIGGHISLVPKGIFRAIVEVDDAGKITGNVRAVLPGPFKLRFEFETPRPHNWRELGLVPGQDFVDWRAFQPTKLLDGSWAEQVQNFSVRQAVGDLRQMELKRLVFDVKVLNTDIVKVSTDFRLPLKEVTAAFREGVKLGQLAYEAGAGWSGRLLIPIERGLGETMATWRDGGVKSTINADISFAKPFFNGGVNNRIHLDSGKLQDVVMNMRFRGYTLFDAGNVLGLDLSSVSHMYEEGLARSKMFLDEIGVHSLLAVEPEWQRRLYILQQAAANVDFGRVKSIDMNRADMLSKMLDGFTGRRNAGQNLAMRLLANIQANDGASVIELKLRSLVAFMAQSEIGSDDIINKLGYLDVPTIRLLAESLAQDNQAGLSSVG